MSEKPNEMKIVIIYGKAGCGKTTKMIEMMRSMKKYMVLAPTNAAVENIYTLSAEAFGKAPKREKYKTIYSFFRIDYENNIVAGAVFYPKILFIDEFGLMDKHLFKRCLLMAEEGGVEMVVMSGDVMQLNPIYRSKQKVSFNKLKELNQMWQALEPGEKAEKLIYPSVAEHLQLSIFGSRKVLTKAQLIPLTTNKRANDTTKEVLKNIYIANEKFPYEWVEFFDLARLIFDEGYIFIASKYKILQHVFDMIYEARLKDMNAVVINQAQIGTKLGYKRLYLLPNSGIITCQTVKGEYINGQELIFTGEEDPSGLKCINPQTEEIVHVHKDTDKFGHEYYPITPAYLLSVHKSQGRSIDKVIVCVDGMFDISMLYTAITRTKTKLMFYSKEGQENRVKALIDAAFVDEFKQLNIMTQHLAQTLKAIKPRK